MPAIDLLAAEPSSSLFVLIAIMILMILFVFIMMLVIFIRQYKRCPPNHVLVIYGKTRTGQPFQLVHSGAVFVIPIIQDYALLSLEPIQVDIPQPKATSRNVGFNLPRRCIVAVGGTEELLHDAVLRLLGLSREQIASQAVEIIGSTLGHVVETVPAEDGKADHTAFYEQLESQAGEKLALLGLQLVSISRV